MILSICHFEMEWKGGGEDYPRVVTSMMIIFSPVVYPKPKDFELGLASHIWHRMAPWSADPARGRTWRPGRERRQRGASWRSAGCVWHPRATCLAGWSWWRSAAASSGPARGRPCSCPWNLSRCRLRRLHSAWMENKTYIIIVFILVLSDYLNSSGVHCFMTKGRLCNFLMGMNLIIFFKYAFILWSFSADCYRQLNKWANIFLESSIIIIIRRQMVCIIEPSRGFRQKRRYTNSTNIIIIINTGKAIALPGELIWDCQLTDGGRFKPIVFPCFSLFFWHQSI